MAAMVSSAAGLPVGSTGTTSSATATVRLKEEDTSTFGTLMKLANAEKMGGIPIPFLPGRKPFPAQKALMTQCIKAFSNQQNALLESPTGTGKTLALLSASLAYQERVKVVNAYIAEVASITPAWRPDNVLMGLVEESPEGAKGPKFPQLFSASDFAQYYPTPKIFFTSRTHSQLKQAIGELKRCSWYHRADRRVPVPPDVIEAVSKAAAEWSERASRANKAVTVRAVQLRAKREQNEKARREKEAAKKEKSDAAMKPDPGAAVAATAPAAATATAVELAIKKRQAAKQEAAVAAGAGAPSLQLAYESQVQAEAQAKAAFELDYWGDNLAGKPPTAPAVSALAAIAAEAEAARRARLEQRRKEAEVKYGQLDAASGIILIGSYRMVGQSLEEGSVDAPTPKSLRGKRAVIDITKAGGISGLSASSSSSSSAAAAINKSPSRGGDPSRTFSLPSSPMRPPAAAVPEAIDDKSYVIVMDRLKTNVMASRAHTCVHSQVSQPARKAGSTGGSSIRLAMEKGGSSGGAAYFTLATKGDGRGGGRGGRGGRGGLRGGHSSDNPFGDEADDVAAFIRGAAAASGDGVANESAGPRYLQKGFGSLPLDEACKQLIEKKDCPHHQCADKLAAQAPPVWDLEELITISRASRPSPVTMGGFTTRPATPQEIEDEPYTGGGCPYYASRTLLEGAEMIFCPYNYLLDPGIRKGMSLDAVVKGAIVIVDEGHNVPDTCMEAASAEFTREEVVKVLMTMSKLLFDAQSENSGMGGMGDGIFGSGESSNQEYINCLRSFWDPLLTWLSWMEDCGQILFGSDGRMPYAPDISAYKALTPAQKRDLERGMLNDPVAKRLASWQTSVGQWKVVGGVRMTAFPITATSAPSNGSSGPGSSSSNGAGGGGDDHVWKGDDALNLFNMVRVNDATIGHLHECHRRMEQLEMEAKQSGGSAGGNTDLKATLGSREMAFLSKFLTVASFMLAKKVTPPYGPEQLSRTMQDVKDDERVQRELLRRGVTDQEAGYSSDGDDQQTKERRTAARLHRLAMPLKPDEVVAFALKRERRHAEDFHLVFTRDKTLSGNRLANFDGTDPFGGGFNPGGANGNGYGGGGQRQNRRYDDGDNAGGTGGVLFTAMVESAGPDGTRESKKRVFRGDTPNHKLSFTCLSPAVAFRELSLLCGSVVLTSGTLSPLNSFASELGTPFHNRLEAPHVIDIDKQLRAAVIGAAPTANHLALVSSRLDLTPIMLPAWQPVPKPGALPPPLPPLAPLSSAPSAARLAGPGGPMVGTPSGGSPSSPAGTSAAAPPPPTPVYTQPWPYSIISAPAARGIRYSIESIGGKDITGTFKGSQGNEYLDAVGSAVLSAATRTPGGMLVFVSSYKVLDRCIQRWQDPNCKITFATESEAAAGSERGGGSRVSGVTEISLWEALNKVKRVFYESRNAGGNTNSNNNNNDNGGDGGGAGGYRGGRGGWRGGRGGGRGGAHNSHSRFSEFDDDSDSNSKPAKDADASNNNNNNNNAAKDLFADAFTTMFRQFRRVNEVTVRHPGHAMGPEPQPQQPQPQQPQPQSQQAHSSNKPDVIILDEDSPSNNNSRDGYGDGSSTVGSKRSGIAMSLGEAAGIGVAKRRKVVATDDATAPVDPFSVPLEPDDDAVVREAAADTRCTGAILLAVCRGKASEGLDFADFHARTVVLVGIPFANVSETNVAIKKSYQDGLHRSSDMLVQANRLLNNDPQYLNYAKARQEQQKQLQLQQQQQQLQASGATATAASAGTTTSVADLGAGPSSLMVAPKEGSSSGKGGSNNGPLPTAASAVASELLGAAGTSQEVMDRFFHYVAAGFDFATAAQNARNSSAASSSSSSSASSSSSSSSAASTAIVPASSFAAALPSDLRAAANRVGWGMRHPPSLYFAAQAIQSMELPISGDLWYKQQAFRALNQALGRVIRHKNDYGSILLLDTRFNGSSEREMLSRWVRPAVTTGVQWYQVMAELGNFFPRMATVFPPAPPPAPAAPTLASTQSLSALPSNSSTLSSPSRPGSSSSSAFVTTSVPIGPAAALGIGFQAASSLPSSSSSAASSSSFPSAASLSRYARVATSAEASAAAAAAAAASVSRAPRVLANPPQPQHAPPASSPLRPPPVPRNAAGAASASPSPARPAHAPAAAASIAAPSPARAPSAYEEAFAFSSSVPAVVTAVIIGKADEDEEDADNNGIAPNGSNHNAAAATNGGEQMAIDGDDDDDDDDDEAWVRETLLRTSPRKPADPAPPPALAAAARAAVRLPAAPAPAPAPAPGSGRPSLSGADAHRRLTAGGGSIGSGGSASSRPLGRFFAKK